jgi:SAM-dependent methyltransferase
METTNCNLCGSERCRVLYEKADEFYHRSEYFSVVECLDCGLGYVCPRPTVDEISEYYPAAFYNQLDAHAASDRRRFVAQSTYLSSIPSSGKKPRILDVGSANGGFIEFMQELGWEVEGVEPFSPRPDFRGFHVYRSQFPDIPVEGPSYEAVTAWAVLEHVHDPRAYFEKAAQVLVRGGIFAFMIPNFGSLVSRRLFGEDIPRHLYFFTEPNIRRYTREAGFSLEIADHRNPAFVSNPYRWLHYLVARSLGRPFQWPIERSYSDFLASNRLDRGPASALRFARRDPLGFADSLLAPLLGQVERLLRCYGVVVYVARKQ